MIVACVKVGNKYGPEYVYRLRDMVAAHLEAEHEFVCLTDDPHSLRHVETFEIDGHKWPGWWSKMALFEPIWRRDYRVLYLDLDTVLVNELDSLTKLEVEFGICENFARRAGLNHWPCKYGSCVMSLAPEFGADVWEKWERNSERLMQGARRYGDQLVIEQLVPNVALLQGLLPKGYFLNHRDLIDVPDERASIITFGGPARPDNCNFHWVKSAWLGQ